MSRSSELHRAHASRASAASHVTAVLAALSVNWTAPSAVAPPKIPPVWSATVQAVEEVDGKPTRPNIGGETSLQLICNDDTLKRGVVQMTTKVPFAPAAFVGTALEWINTTEFQTKALFGINLNGVKLDGTAAYGAHYSSVFSWLPYAKAGPNVPVNGTVYLSWALQTPTASLSLLVNSHNLPHRFEENVTVPKGNTSFTYHLRYTFESFTSNGTLPGTWETFNPLEYTSPIACAKPPSPAPVATTRMYIFHPRAQFNITQQDLGSPTGDALFLCIEGHTGGGHDYEWISTYDVLHVQQYGEYQNCNGYDPPKCLGSEDFLVGHEAAMGLGPGAAGQCTDNPQVGEWYSLPAGGKCSDGQSPGDGSCTWRASRVKTIDSACLFDPALGYFAACKAGEERAPFTAATTVFEKAFSFDDPAEGGCPGLPGPA